MWSGREAERNMIKNGNIVTAQRAYVSIVQIGELGVVVDAPASMRCHPGTLVLITTGGYIVIDEEEVKATGRSLDGATFEKCNAARLCGALGKALIDGKMEQAQTAVTKVSEMINGMELVKVNGQRFEWNETFKSYWSVDGSARNLTSQDIAEYPVENGDALAISESPRGV